MRKTTLAFLLIITTNLGFAADVAIFNMTKSPMELTYHVCTEVPLEGTQCENPTVETTIKINAMDGNGKNYQIVSLEDHKQIFVDKAVVRNGSNINTYSLSCGGGFGNAIVLDNMGGTPALVCKDSLNYTLPNS